MSLSVTLRGHLSDEVLASATPYPEILREIVRLREVTDIDAFLTPPAIDQDFFSTFQALFGDQLSTAVSVIKDAITSGTSITIHGDYDVDGVCATAILWEAIYYGLGYQNVHPFIPHRVDHGYGLSELSINDIGQMLNKKGEKPGLLITVDCGIVSKNQVEYAKTLGFEVIVTDHHTRPEHDEDLPNAAAILHSHKLCGAGIAWVLARTLVGDELTEGVDLAAMATLADVQSVVGLNRSIIATGLQELSRTSRVGLQALYSVAGISNKPIGVYEVGWVIGPRINATGRLHHALDALRLLIARNRRAALEIAASLDQLNNERQEITKEAVFSAQRSVKKTWKGNSPIIVADPGWHEGVIGLIASRLVEMYKVPAIAISLGEELAKGSARSVDGINIVDLLRQYSHHMIGVGGHDMAAGFSLKPENVSSLIQSVTAHDLGTTLTELQSKPLIADFALPLPFVNWELFEALAQLEPHGIGNARPTFLFSGVPLTSVRAVGKEADHLQVQVGAVRGIGFGLGSKIDSILPGQMVDVVASVDKDDFRGGNSVQLKVQDLDLSNE